MAVTSSVRVASMPRISLLSPWMRRARVRITVLVVNNTGSEPLRGRNAAASATSPVLYRSLNRERIGSGAQNTRWRSWFNVWIRC